MTIFHVLKYCPINFAAPALASVPNSVWTEFMQWARTNRVHSHEDAAKKLAEMLLEYDGDET